MEMVDKITLIFSWIVLISFFCPIILLGFIQFLLACFTIVFNFIMCIVNPKYLIDFYSSIGDDDYE